MLVYRFWHVVVWLFGMTIKNVIMLVYEVLACEFQPKIFQIYSVGHLLRTIFPKCLGNFVLRAYLEQ